MSRSIGPSAGGCASTTWIPAGSGTSAGRVRPARASWSQARESERADGGQLSAPLLRAWKLEGHAARVALVLHAAEHGPDPRWTELAVSGETMTTALALADRLVDHYFAVVANNSVTPVDRIATRLLNWGRHSQWKSFDLRSAWQQLKDKQAVTSKRDLENPLGMLTEYGYLRQRTRAQSGKKASPRFDWRPELGDLLLGSSIAEPRRNDTTPLHDLEDELLAVDVVVPCQVCGTAAAGPDGHCTMCALVVRPKSTGPACAKCQQPMTTPRYGPTGQPLCKSCEQLNRKGVA